jgi:Ca2+-transporting ATPase
VKAPFTVLQLLWINVIMDTFASIALCSEPPRPAVMKLPPKHRDENILSPAMVRTIATTACFFIVVMLGLLLLMKGSPAAPGWFAGSEPVVVDGHFTVLQVSIFFSIYVFYQVWNQINCRSLTAETSGFHRMFANPLFLAIAATVALGQVLIVTFGGKVFNVEPLHPVTWVVIGAFTSTVLIFAEIARRIRLHMWQTQTFNPEPTAMAGAVAAGSRLNKGDHP